ncbi:unnamed protein product [Hymenolepis diminuta]|uniref:Uncharacterized protein n=1 Tax=Hymenolepis diminuta TaxID=6216 RepID=A0A564ZFP2_HYMDI|nr:unnamed protein product [Hymenolepis diminuta]
MMPLLCNSRSRNPVCLIIRQTNYAAQMDRKKIALLSSFTEHLNRPPRSSLQNVLVSAIISRPNHISFSVLGDRHLWMMNSNKTKK